MTTSLKFPEVYKVTISGEDVAPFSFVAMGVKQSDVFLPDGSVGVRLRYVVNNPDRFEHDIRGTVTHDAVGAVVVERFVEEVALDETVYTYQFEPLTLENWKEMDVAGADELLQELPDDAALQAYYWNDWVPAYWLEAESE